MLRAGRVHEIQLAEIDHDQLRVRTGELIELERRDA
jgi:hypothetical protein